MDSISTVQLFIILIVCLFLSGFFSASETGLLSLNKYRLRADAKHNIRGAKSSEIILKKTDRLLVFILIFNNVVNIIASSVATIIGLRLYGDAGIAIATGLLTLVLLIFAEIIPKTIANKYPDKISYNFSPIIKILMFVFKPAIIAINYIINIVLKLLGINNTSSLQQIGKEELKIIINDVAPNVQKDFKEILSSILGLEEITIADIMIHKQDISAIDINDDIKSIIRQLIHAEHKTLVVYKESLSKKILGTIRVREAYRLLIDTNDFSKETIVRAIDEPNFVPESTLVNQQLVNFKQEKNFLVLVVNEYGELTGLLTLEDIFEEIIGKFTHSTITSLDEHINEQSKGVYIIDGGANIRDLNKNYSWNLESEESRTINGLLLEKFLDIPKVGDVLEIDNLTITILKTDSTMIKQVKIVVKKQ